MRKWKYVNIESSNVKRVGYDLESQALEIEFAGGGRYRYEAVPAAVVCALIFAPSPGSYFAKAIKPHHKCEKVEEVSA